MKKITFIPLLFIVVVFCNFNCKKNNIKPVCGCDADPVSSIGETNATLAYFQSKNLWALSASSSGIVNNYLICNSNDSLLAITSSGSITNFYNVKFSGEIKSTCSNENFGVTPGNTSFYYIKINSLKRN